ncbi:hypothetical protein B0H19DRAFT_1085801 [Mycena capillaripes]|nr:hypothetical protein B0H19DRAFT_1085801 [Mycena capillaripes]
MSAFARERIKRAHNGRETRGVLAETTSTAVGSSTRSIISLFLNCALLFFTPLDKLSALPLNSDPELVDGLKKAHRKLSDYYYKFDQSPFYIWAALLDPRFNHKKLRRDYVGDPELLQYIED